MALIVFYIIKFTIILIIQYKLVIRKKELFTMYRYALYRGKYDNTV